MRQVLFRIPPWSDDGIPVYGFGLMLFITFVLCCWAAAKRAEKEGFNGQLMWDLAIWAFVGGIVGARAVYMIQYGVPIWQFLRIWEGGLVFYGSALGGIIAVSVAYRLNLQKVGMGFRQMLDIIAPAVALGLCLGRIGCLLNGCCYGHVACTSCPAIHFPLSAPPRFTLVKAGLQTAAGFTLSDPKDGDPISVIAQVEPDSPAEQSGLRPGDVVLGIDGKPNQRILEVRGRQNMLDGLARHIGDPVEKEAGEGDFSLWLYAFDTSDKFKNALQETEKFRFDTVRAYDSLWDQLQRPRSKTSLALKVQHADSKIEELPSFSPRTLGLYPTQIYESISMALLFFVLCAYTPLRRRYGEVFVLLLFGYALHRFINEQLRNDTDPITLFGRIETHMTLSQNVSILIVMIGVVMGLWVWSRPVDFPSPAVKAESHPV